MLVKFDTADRAAFPGGGGAGRRGLVEKRELAVFDTIFRSSLVKFHWK